MLFQDEKKSLTQLVQIFLILSAVVQIIGCSSFADENGDSFFESNMSGLVGGYDDYPLLDDLTGQEAEQPAERYYLRSGKRSDPQRVVRRTTSRSRTGTMYNPRYEALSLLRTKKDSTGKGDRWADYNLLRTGKRNQAEQDRNEKKESSAKPQRSYWNAMHLRTRRANTKTEMNAANGLPKKDFSNWLLLRTRKSLWPLGLNSFSNNDEGLQAEHQYEDEREFGHPQFKF